VDVPFRTLAVLFAALAVIAFAGIVIAARLAMRRPAISALRDE